MVRPVVKPLIAEESTIPPFFESRRNFMLPPAMGVAESDHRAPCAHGRDEVGLLIGQATTKRDYLLFCIRVPMSGANSQSVKSPGLAAGAFAAATPSSSSSSCPSSLFFRAATPTPRTAAFEETMLGGDPKRFLWESSCWVCTFAREISYMLFGGMDILGLYFFMTEESLQQNAEHIQSMVVSLWQATQDTALIPSDARRHALLVPADRRGSFQCLSFNCAGTRGGLTGTPTEVRFAIVAGSMHTFVSRVTCQLYHPIVRPDACGSGGRGMGGAGRKSLLGVPSNAPRRKQPAPLSAAVKAEQSRRGHGDPSDRGSNSIAGSSLAACSPNVISRLQAQIDQYATCMERAVARIDVPAAIAIAAATTTITTSTTTTTTTDPPVGSVSVKLRGSALLSHDANNFGRIMDLFPSDPRQPPSSVAGQPDKRAPAQDVRHAHDVRLFLPTSVLAQESLAVAALEALGEEVVGSIFFHGEITAIAQLHGKSSPSVIVRALSLDIQRSLRTRIETLADCVDEHTPSDRVSPFAQVEPANSVELCLPRRVFLTSPRLGEGIGISGYVLAFQLDSECLKFSSEMFGTRLSPWETSYNWKEATVSFAANGGSGNSSCSSSSNSGSSGGGSSLGTATAKTVTADMDAGIGAMPGRGEQDYRVRGSGSRRRRRSRVALDPTGGEGILSSLVYSPCGQSCVGREPCDEDGGANGSPSLSASALSSFAHASVCGSDIVSPADREQYEALFSNPTYVSDTDGQSRSKRAGNPPASSGPAGKRESAAAEEEEEEAVIGCFGRDAPSAVFATLEHRSRRRQAATPRAGGLVAAGATGRDVARTCPATAGAGSPGSGGIDEVLESMNKQLQQFSDRFVAILWWVLALLVMVASVVVVMRSSVVQQQQQQQHHHFRPL